MAEVRLGFDLHLGRSVAIKQLSPELADDPAARARFQQEARSAASLHHPGIVAVYDTGEEIDPATGHRAPYIVMELVQGQTLGSMLRRGEQLGPAQATTITQGLLAALAYSHAAGIVHQDIKPGNVMLTDSGQVKLLDFGIAHTETDTVPAAPATMVLGTAKYLSPEQARGEITDIRSDIYSAGCLMYELLVGRPPFLGDSVTAITSQHLSATAVPPSEHNDEVGPELDAVVLTALAKAPADRYQSADQMRAALDALQPRDTRVAGPLPAAAVVPATSAAPLVSRARASAGHARAAAGPRRALPARAAESSRRPVATPRSNRGRRRAALATSALVAVLFPIGGFGLYNANRAVNQDEANAATVLNLPGAATGTPSAKTSGSPAASTATTSASRAGQIPSAKERTPSAATSGTPTSSLRARIQQTAGGYVQAAARTLTGASTTDVSTSTPAGARPTGTGRSVDPTQAAPAPTTERPAVNPAAGGTRPPRITPPKPRAVTPTRPPTTAPAKPVKTRTPSAAPRPSTTSKPRPSSRPSQPPVSQPREDRAERAKAREARRAAQREARQQRRAEREAARRPSETAPQHGTPKADKPKANKPKAEKPKKARSDKRSRDAKQDEAKQDEAEQDEQANEKPKKNGWKKDKSKKDKPGKPDKD